MQHNENKFIKNVGIISAMLLIIFLFSQIFFFNTNKKADAVAQSFCATLPVIGDPALGVVRGLNTGHGCRTDKRTDSTCTVFVLGTFRCKQFEYLCGIQRVSVDCDKTKGNCQDVRPICCASQ